MTSETRRQTSDDLCARIDAVVTGHEQQRSHESAQQIGMSVGDTWIVIGRAGDNVVQTPHRCDNPECLGGQPVFTPIVGQPVFTPIGDHASLLTRVLRRLAELTR